MSDNVNPHDSTVQQAEIPQHYAYIYKFRVEQCPLFLQHKCTQHRPFTCFHWHFQNQRRRKPLRRRDGSLNYSADEYCTKYDETTGICQDGDECPFLHRTAGDTERRYHLRYFKTAPCVHETDNRGFCSKNGVHCAFAHGNSDLRNPVYDIRDIRSKETAEVEFNGLNTLDKERSLLNDDPKWQDTTYVLTNYKTDQCKKPPRLCRQGYACPQYHNSRDRRRSPKKFKYRSTPCPNAKHGEEWGDPSGCDNGDLCQYCHTRTEQQFHPEIYKSTKCHDMQTNSYCPRGSFCAFAHGDFEVVRENGQYLDNGANLAELLSNALPSVGNQQSSDKGNGVEAIDQLDLLLDSNSPRTLIDNHSNLSIITASTSVPIQTAFSRLQSLETGESVLASSGPTAHIGPSLGGFGPLVHPVCKPRSLSVPGTNMSSSLGLDRMISLDRDEWDHPTHISNSDILRDQFDTNPNKPSLYTSGTLGGLLSHLQPASYFPSATRLNNSSNTECVIGSTVDETEEQFNDNNRIYEAEQPSLCESITRGVASSGLLTGSAPVNIPRSGLERHPPRLSPSPPALSLFSTIRVGTQDVASNGQSNNASFFFKKVGSQPNTGVSFHEWANHQQTSPGSGNSHRVLANSSASHSPLRSTITSLASSLGNHDARSREETALNIQAKVLSLEEDLSQARQACDVWRCKAIEAEQQRDEAIATLTSLQNEMRVLRESLSGYQHRIKETEEIESAHF